MDQAAWRRRYASALGKAADRAAHAPDERELIACGFTTNVDLVVDLNQALLDRLLTGQALDLRRPLAAVVASVPDLLAAIVRHAALGTGTDLPVAEAVVQRWLIERVGGRRQVGGTGAQAACTLSRLGFRPLLHATGLSAPQVAVLEETGEILVAGDDGPRPVGQVVTDTDPTMWHVALEYLAGLVVPSDGGTVAAPAANRVIVSHDPVNASFSVAPSFVEAVADPANNVQRVLVSGFSQVIEPRARARVLRETVAALRRWRRARPNILTHAELGAMPEPAMMANVAQGLAPAVDSIGFNADELGDLLAAWRFASVTESHSLAAALKTVRNRIPAPRLGLHTARICLTLTMSDPETERDALLFASLVAATRARIGTFPAFADLADSLTPMVVDQRGLAVVRSPGLVDGIGRVGDDWLVGVPGIVVDHPAATVGLGDSFTGALLALL